MKRTIIVAAAALLAACGPAGPFRSPEGAAYDAAGDRFLLTNAGDFADESDGFLLALDADGLAQEERWAPREGDPPLANPLGIAIHGGTVYVADSPFIRRFELATGRALAPFELPGVAQLNDVAVAEDGAIYVTDTGGDRTFWAVYRVSPSGEVATLVRDVALSQPNGIDIGPDGRIYVAAMASPSVIVLDASGAVAETLAVPHAGNDGLVVLADGLVVSSVTEGIVSRVHADGASRTLDGRAPSAASLGLDPTRRRVLVPLLNRNDVRLLDID